MRRKLLLIAMVTAFCLLVACHMSEESREQDISGSVEIYYEAFVDVISAQNYVLTKEFQLPENINGHSVICSDIIDKEHILLRLCDDTSDGMLSRELGCYNIWTNEYETCLVLEKSQDIEIVYADNEVIVLRTSYDGWITMSIAYIQLSDFYYEEFFDYSTDPQTGYCYPTQNNVVRIDNSIFFDDIFVDDDGELCVDLFCYDIVSHVYELVKKNAQNPLPYGDNIIVITQDENSQYKVLSLLSGEKVLDIDVYLMYLASSEENIYCIENAYTNNEEHYTIQQLTNLKSGNGIFSTENTIANLTASEQFLAFTNFIPEYPCVYSIEHDCLLVFDNLTKGAQTFFLSGDYGYFLNRDDSETSSYYYFEKI